LRVALPSLRLKLSAWGGRSLRKGLCNKSRVPGFANSSRTWAGARAQSVLMSVWRTYWQQGRSALEFLSQLLRGTPVALALTSEVS
jgi:hypothetical protein